MCLPFLLIPSYKLVNLRKNLSNYSGNWIVRFVQWWDKSVNFEGYGIRIFMGSVLTW